MENTILSETCKICGKCCQNYPFVKLSKNDINSLEKATKLYFDVFTNPIGKVIEGYFLQFQKNGDCFFLKEHNGSYSCSVYETRPEMCKNYPSKPKQKEFCSANSVLGNGVT